jgi:glutathione S-transferase
MAARFTLVIGNKNYSSWSMRPWLALTHNKIPFKEILIPLYQDGAKEKILAHSPAGKVPARRRPDGVGVAGDHRLHR